MNDNIVHTQVPTVPAAKQEPSHSNAVKSVEDLHAELAQVRAERDRLLQESEELRKHKHSLKQRMDVLSVKMRDKADRLKKEGDPKLMAEQVKLMTEMARVKEELDKALDQYKPFQAELGPLFEKVKELEAKIRVLDPTGVFERSRDKRNFRTPMARRNKTERDQDHANECCLAASQALHKQSQELKAKERELLSQSELKAEAAEKAGKPEQAVKIRAEALEQIKELHKELQDLSKAVLPAKTSRNGRRKASTLEVMKREQTIKKSKNKAQAREEIRALRRERKNARKGKSKPKGKGKSKSKNKGKGK
jgi:hypothetical protein